MTAEQKQNLLKVLNDYMRREFDDEYQSVNDIPDVIPLGYTTSDEETHEVQVDFDLTSLEWKEYIDGELKIVSKRDSIEDFIDELDGLSFDSVVSDILWMANEMEEKEEE